VKDIALIRTLALMTSLALLSACPPPGGDDDDSATPPDTGPAPVVTGVALCEVPALANCEAPRFGVRFGITATDEDDNMNNERRYIQPQHLWRVGAGWQPRL
jgi:hypothetical protein